MVIHHALIFQHLLVYSSLYPHENIENHGVASNRRRSSLDTFVSTHIFDIILIFGAKHLIPKILLCSGHADALQLLNVLLHLVRSQFFNIFLLEDPFEFFQQGNLLRVFGVESALQFLAGLFQNILEFVGNDQFSLRNLAEMELDLV